MELDWGTAIVSTVQFAIGSGFVWLGKYLSQHVKWRIGRVLLSWPCFGIGFIFLSSAVVTILWNMFGPIVLWLLGLMQ
jgi:hypothetical protein